MLRAVAAILSISLCFLSCSQRQMEASLRDIETYIQERPDSAFIVLRVIDTLQLRTMPLRAHYSLLQAIALDKNYVDTSDVRIIQPALSFYTGKDDRAMMTHYYAGRIYENGDDYSNALVHYFSALDLADPENYKYLGLINYAIGNTYHLSYSFEEELEYHIRALESFEKLGDGSYIDYSTFGLANAYHNNRDFHTADSLYREICSRGDTLRPIVLSSMLAMADNSLKSGEFDAGEIRSLFESAIGHGGEMTLEYYYEYAYVLARLGETAASDAVLQSLSAYPDSYTSYWWHYKIEQEKGNHREADSLLESSLQLQDDVIRDKIRQSVFKSQSDHYRYAMLAERREHTILHQRYLLMTVFLLLVISAIVLISRRRKHLMMRDREKMLLAVGESERLLQMTRTDADTKCAEQEMKMLDLQRMYVNLYQKQFMEIGRYYDASYFRGSEKVTQKIVKSIAPRIDDIIAEMTSQSGNQYKFEERINMDADDIVTKIRSDYPRYSEDDIRFICYLIAGFDATTISVLMNITGDNARVKRCRIRHRLLSDSGPNASLYRAWFE